MAGKVFINEKNMATFICPECQKAKTTNVAKYKHIETAIKVNCKCPCGHKYKVLLERRKFNRKELNLPGKYICLKNDDRGLMTVADISRTGLGLRLNVERKFDKGEKLLLEFNLDDRERSFIKREVYVRSVNGLAVGCEFCRHDHQHDALGPYLAWQVG